MFFKIAGFEFRYQLRQPIFWVAVVLFAVLAFGSVASDNIQIGSSDNIHKNAAFAICLTTAFFALIFMFVVTAFVANVITRDDETGFGSIVRSTPIRKGDYLYGRFTGAMFAAALAFLSVPAGLMLGAAAPWVDPQTLGPFQLAPYAYAYGVIGLPVLFITGALFFTLTTLTRSMMWTYVGVIVLLVCRAIFGIVLNRPGLEHIAAISEPLGFDAFMSATRYWTASERNTLLPAIQGDIVFNRLIWMGLAIAILALAYRLFSFQSADLSGRRVRKQAKTEAPAATPAPAITADAPHAKPKFGAATLRAQLWARIKLDAAQVFKSPAYFVLLGLAALLSLVNLWLATDIGAYGGKIFPVTRAMILALNGAFTFFALVIAVYYAGELVWRERERRTQEIIDAAPVPDWMFLGPKVAAIAVVLISTLLVAVVVAIATQAVRGFFEPELGKYLLWYVLPNAIDMTLIAVLAVFVQSLSPNKYVGWAVMVVYFISTIIMGNLGLEDNLYNYGSGPELPLSDMNGQGQYWIGAYWFRLYWAAFATILLVVTYGLWRRGTETRLGPRLARLPHRLRGATGAVLVLALVVFVGVGGFNFYNTHILNPYRTHLDTDKWTADYEKKYLRYETLPQPKVTAVKLDFDLYPHQLKVVTRGSYVIANHTNAPIKVLHLRFDRDLEVGAIDVPGAHLQSNDTVFNYRIYAFDKPMQPGESRTLQFITTREQRGFKNSGNFTDLMDNGSFIHDGVLTPQIGMDRSGALQDRTKRRKYGLVPELRMPKLGQPGADAVNYLRHDSDWITSDITLTTDADQTPIAPGYRQSEVVRGGRRTVHFMADSPVLNYASVLSARYVLSRETYKGINLGVYYDPQHPWNVPLIKKAMKAGLDYYQANFSPYQFRQYRELEFPAPQGAFAESFPNTVAWSEGIFFIADNRDTANRIDMVTYVGAHELAHQWWAHQVIGADEQGSTVLSETLAQYSAAMVMKHMYGPDMMRKFLKFELDSYLRGRGGDVLPEEPLEKVENQQYIHYRKGSLVMYRLQDEIGEDAVNRALRHLLHDYAFKGPPYPTSLDLVKDLRAEAPADKQQLITDLFEKITLYDIKATKAVSQKRADGRYNVTLTVTAKKLYADGSGKETEAPMNETLDVGAFDLSPGDDKFSSKHVVAFQRMPIHSGTQTLTFIAPRAVTFAGVDPYDKLIDRNTEANVTKVAGK